MTSCFRLFRRVPALSLGALLLTAAPVGAMEPHASEPALFRLDTAQTHGSFFGRLEQGKRQLSGGTATRTFDTRRITAGLSVRLAPSLYGWSEAGISQAQIRGRIGPTLEQTSPEDGSTQQISSWFEADRKGDPGLAWGIGGGLQLLDVLLKESPVLGPREWIQLELQISHRQSRSDLPAGPSDDETLRWADTRLTPMLIYTRDQRSDPTLASFSPTGYSLRAGISLYRTRGKLGPRSFETEDGIGFELGSDLRLRSGWTCRLQALWLDTSNRETSLALLKRF